MKKITLMIVIARILSCYADISQNISPEILRDISENNLSRSAIKNDMKNSLFKNYQNKSENDSIYSNNNEIIDSTEVSTFDTLNIYEKILRGDTINPDSMLPELKIFGHKFFESASPTTFAPVNAFNVPSNYKIGTDDEINILLWGRINDEYTLTVDGKGSILIPRIGPIHVAGMSFNNMEKNIINRIQKIEGVKVAVSLGKIKKIGVFIVGEVKKPGFYTISSLSNITNALYAAGGPNKNGSLRNIQLKRNKKIITTIDMYDFLLNGNDNSSFRLQSNDVIHIPLVKSMISISGNVRRPAIYEIKEKSSLKNILKLSGGITPAAWSNKIQIERLFNNQRQIILDIDTIKNEIPDITVMDGDIIKIFPILNKCENAVYLTGNVVRPGKYEFKKNMRLSDLIPTYNDILPESYLEYAAIIRQDPPRFLNRILTFNLKDALDNTNSNNNLYLQPRDHIIIYHLDFFEPDRNVQIEGSVTQPGKYKILDNMKIRDLILQAGGLSEDASTIRGELYRREYNSKNDQANVKKIDFCVECAMNNDKIHNYILNRLDRIFIRKKSGWEKERKVILEGQFNYPGTYILFEKETLGDLIDRAGGFKENAFVSAAFFSRRSVKEIEEKRKAEYSNQMESDLINISSEFAFKDNPQQAQQILNQQQDALEKNLKEYNYNGRVVIDLTNDKNYNDFTLEDGDSLFIPRMINTVSVIGEVYNPTTFKYENAKNSVAYYIEAAGGIKITADKKYIYVIKANGIIITNKNVNIRKLSLEPGDAVVVPKKLRFSNPHKMFVDTIDAIFKISSLLGTVIALIIAIDRINE